MSPREAIENLCEVVEQEQPRIVRLWAKRLRAETHALDIPGDDLREPLVIVISELARLLRTRGDEAIALWPESVRSIGARRYRQHFSADDLAREFKALQLVLLRVYSRRRPLEPQVAELIAELVGEATANAEATFARLLRTEEVRFREAGVMETVLHHLDVGVLVAEPDGALSFATPPLARLLGVPVHSLVGSRAERLLPQLLTATDARHLDGRPFRASEIPLLRAFKEKTPIRGVLMRMRRPDGRELVLELGASPIWEEDATALAGVIQTFTDRSEDARKTDELSTTQDALRLLENKMQQQYRTQALGQLASGTAHALNNFLNVLRLRIILLRRDGKPEHLESLDRTVDSIGELVSRLQDFSNTRSDDELVAVPFSERVRETVELARAELERPDAPLTIELEDLSAPGSVHVDAGFFRELLANLLLAERDRMPDGGRLVVRTLREGDWLTLQLEDTGSSYSKKQLVDLFEPLKNRSQQPHLSLMLGVALNQARRWGGTLECTNRMEGSGVTCTLRLPVYSHEETAAEEGPSMRVQRPAARRVLVVDDDLENARMLAEVLIDEGYSVTPAHSGQQAHQLWDAHSFDAALLDAAMPDMSGWELARELRDRSPTVLLGMVTGLDVRGQNRANLAVLDAVFRKPIDVGALDDFLSRSPGRSDSATSQGMNDAPPIR